LRGLARRGGRRRARLFEPQNDRPLRFVRARLAGLCHQRATGRHPPHPRSQIAFRRAASATKASSSSSHARVASATWPPTGPPFTHALQRSGATAASPAAPFFPDRRLTPPERRQKLSHVSQAMPSCTEEPPRTPFTCRPPHLVLRHRRLGNVGLHLLPVLRLRRVHIHHLIHLHPNPVPELVPFPLRLRRELRRVLPALRTRPIPQSALCPPPLPARPHSGMLTLGRRLRSVCASPRAV
jgi:hypothetical protein